MVLEFRLSGVRHYTLRHRNGIDGGIRYCAGPKSEEGGDVSAIMESIDVTHAPWFQHLGTKEDTLPGQTTTLWLTIVDSMRMIR